MRALFVHDHPFHEIDGTYYSSGALPAQIWERYLNVFKNITVVGRGRKGGDAGQLSFSSHPDVEFNLFYNVSGGIDYLRKRKAIKAHLEPLILEADAVILRLPSFFGVAAAEICAKYDIKYAAEVVGCVWDSNRNYGTLTGKLRAPIAYLQNRRAVNNSSAAIYVTKDFLQKRYPNNSEITSHASDVYINNFSLDVLHAHQKYLQRSTDTYYLGLIANLQVKYKGFDVLFKALQLIKGKTKFRIELQLIGGGNPAYVKKLIAQYNLSGMVNIIGLLPSGQKVFSALDKLDIYVHPSSQEGLPRAVIEAMARACPVLASSAGGIPELIDNRYLHKPGDYKKLAEQLLFYLHNKDELLKMSQENFEKSKEYNRETLDARRNAFWERTKDEVFNTQY